VGEQGAAIHDNGPAGIDSHFVFEAYIDLTAHDSTTCRMPRNIFA
jgi:hypothetical protein